jgi:DNA (cytosine-5)-methyltransferase 1
MEPVTYRIRKLTERECFRLMDVPEEYIDRIQAAGISRSQQYKMAGNSIVVACMYHLFRKLWIDTQIKTLTLF